MMRWLGSLAFNVFYVAWTALVLLTLWVLLPFPRAAMQRGVRLWGEGARVALRLLVGIRHEVRGVENMRNGAVLYACKHQSSWETMIFHALLQDPVFVLKKELTQIPFWGLYARKCDTVVVDRKAGAAAVKGLVRGAKAGFAHGRPMVIFPEGTRSMPGTQRPYFPGIAGVYAQCGVPVVPVAVNSGLFWGRRAFVKQPGTITLEFLPAIEPGMDRRAFLEVLQERVESATRRIEANAAGGCAQAYPPPVESGDKAGKPRREAALAGTHPGDESAETK